MTEEAAIAYEANHEAKIRAEKAHFANHPIYSDYPGCPTCADYLQKGAQRVRHVLPSAPRRDDSCQATTHRGNLCDRRALPNGFCAAHKGGPIRVSTARSNFCKSYADLPNFGLAR